MAGTEIFSTRLSLIGEVAAATPEGAVARCREGREAVREPNPTKQTAKKAVFPVGKPLETEPELEIIEEVIEPKIPIRCTKCGLDKEVPRTKFGDRTGTVRVKCPNCKEPITVSLGK